MEKSESSGPRDRLSELPDSLILVILSLLPMRDVVRTTLLSKRWKDVWTTVPCLNFTDDTDVVSTSRNFLSRALMLWNGTKILKLNIVYHFDTPSFSDLDSWLRVANEKGAEELSINMIDDRPMRDRGICDDTAPPSLYACSSIRNLSLLSCHLIIDDGNVHWDQLKRLEVYFVPVSEHAMNQVLSGAPQLEVLFLHLMESDEDLNIRSSSLRELTVYKHPDLGSEWETNDTVLTIWAPALEKLDISGILYSKYLLTNVSSLTDASLVLHDEDEGYKLHGEMLVQAFRSIQHVERVTLSDWFFKVPGLMKQKDLLSPASDTKFLKVYVREVEQIVDLLETFPQLTTLALEILDLVKYERERITEPVVVEFDEDDLLKSKTDFPEPHLLQLRTVEITWIALDASIYSLTEFLLKHASELEKIVFWLPPESVSLAAKKLSSMLRSSPNAKLILRENLS